MDTNNIQNLKQCQQTLLDEFCTQEKLPDSYKTIAEAYFFPLADEIIQEQKKNQTNQPLIIGINGSQGSGKSTLAMLLSQIFNVLNGMNVANLSIDDFYKTKEERKQSAVDIHPLLSTRGVPGTHDIDLLNATLKQLSLTGIEASIPRFDKSTDDRHVKSEWGVINTPVDIILLEGWCVGARPQTQQQLNQAINTLEEREDPKGIWRNHINQVIVKDYLPIFERLDKLIMLKAPSFNCVYNWRQKQEDKLKAKRTDNKTLSVNSSGIMNTVELQRFIQHYERLTVDMLSTLPQYADTIFTLNSDHTVSTRSDRSPPNTG